MFSVSIISVLASQLKCPFSFSKHRFSHTPNILLAHSAEILITIAEFHGRSTGWAWAPVAGRTKLQQRLTVRCPTRQNPVDPGAVLYYCESGTAPIPQAENNLKQLVRFSCIFFKNQLSLMSSSQRQAYNNFVHTEDGNK